ncbi:MAG: EamA family transporter [Acidimicrobiia bacterium]|nr:EamA family transporter [Acidimicrobiia bacterium]MYJ14343.1 EamA family transporter [Acidimicrobiia bacterium]
MRRFDHSRIPSEPLFVLGATSQFVGQALAVTLFDELRPGGTALLRVLGAALMIVALRRSWRRRWTAAELRWASVFGVVLAAMNLAIYYSVELVPLGNAVAIEFMGPVAVAALGTRTVRSGAALALAAAGVAVLAGVETDGTLRGVGFALVAGAFWAGYIVLGHRVARGAAWVDGLGVGMLVGALAISPFGIPHIPTAIRAPSLLGLALLVGLASNVIPYGLDQWVMRRIDQRRFALLQALAPVTAAIVGFVGLSQVPTGREYVGIGLVVVAIVLSRTASGPTQQPANPKGPP